MTCKFSAETGEIFKYPIRSIFQNFYPSYCHSHAVSDQQDKAAKCISKCKSGELGLSVSYCSECGHIEMHNRSCNNRDCPCCQTPLEQKWVMDRNAELINGIAYYHVIFTIPAQLNPLIFENQKLLYDNLFSAASASLLSLCRDKKYMGATPGIVSVLHTWGQKLNFHPHLHVMLSGGGLTSSGNFVETKHKGFIIPEAVLAKVFRGKYLDGLKSLYDRGLLSFKGNCSCLKNPYEWKNFINKLYSMKWLPFIKETFNGNGNAVEYLARYAYRTAISNSRIEEISYTHVSFRYTDYADGNTKKLMTVTGEEFIRMFMQHVLPKGFHRVRFSGFLANHCKTKQLKHIKRLRGDVYTGSPTKGKNTAELLKMIYGVDIYECPCCKHRMQTGFSRRIPMMS